MISDASKRWIEAAKTLGKDPTALVPCPQCQQHNLLVTDIPLKFAGPEALGIEWDTPTIDRLMRCPGCGAHNYLLMKKLDS